MKAEMCATGLIGLLVGLSTLVHGQQSGTCCEALKGVWMNELNSTMNLKCTNTGLLVGAYSSAVGNATGYYNMYGSFTDGTVGSTCIVGWSVAYNSPTAGNSKSLASWTGIYFYAEKKIYTQWILARDVTRQNLWASSTINHDEFIRKP